MVVLVSIISFVGLWGDNMKLDVSSIVKTNGASLDIEFKDSIPALSSLEAEISLNEKVDFVGKLVNSSGVLKLDGRLIVNFKIKCSRCLKDIDDDLSIKVREDILDEFDETDKEMYTYKDNYILIDDILKDNILLNLPVKKVCSNDCKGLCPRCGQDLNEKQCDCKDDNINPQMEILKKFFEN